MFYATEIKEKLNYGTRTVGSYVENVYDGLLAENVADNRSTFSNLLEKYQNLFPSDIMPIMLTSWQNIWRGSHILLQLSRLHTVYQHSLKS